MHCVWASPVLEKARSITLRHGLCCTGEEGRWCSLFRCLFGLGLLCYFSSTAVVWYWYFISRRCPFSRLELWFVDVWVVVGFSLMCVVVITYSTLFLPSVSLCFPSLGWRRRWPRTPSPPSSPTSDPGTSSDPLIMTTTPGNTLVHRNQHIH